VAATDVAAPATGQLRPARLGSSADGALSMSTVNGTPLSALWSLQEHDSAIDQLRRRLGALPERAAAHELNERRHALQDRLAALDAQLAELATAEEQVER